MAKAKKDDDFTFEIVEHYEDLTEPNEKSWRKEFNLVKWGDNEPTYDVRSWNEDHSKCSKGCSMKYEELAILVEACSEHGIC
jgi:hypothetical protein